MIEADNSKKINGYGGRGHSKRFLLNEVIEQELAGSCETDGDYALRFALKPKPNRSHPKRYKG